MRRRDSSVRHSAISCHLTHSATCSSRSASCCSHSRRSSITTRSSRILTSRRHAAGNGHGADRSARGGRRGSSSSSRRRVISPGTYLAIVLYTLPGFVFGSVIHELSHAAIALRCGDPTPRRDGRMTLDPRKNLDPFGCFALLIAGFGWGRPVSLDPLYLREGRRRAAVAAVG